MTFVTTHADAILIAVYLVVGLIAWRLIATAVRRRRHRHENRWLSGREAYRRMLRRQQRERRNR